MSQTVDIFGMWVFKMIREKRLYFYCGMFKCIAWFAMDGLSLFVKKSVYSVQMSNLFMIKESDLLVSMLYSL